MTPQLHLLVSPKHRLFPNSNSTNNIIKDNKKIQSTKKAIIMLDSLSRYVIVGHHAKLQIVEYTSK